MQSLSSGIKAAVIISVALLAWMLVGSLAADEPYKNPRKLTQEGGLQAVQVKQIQRQTMRPKVKLSGRTSANREVLIKAEVNAKVMAVTVNKGVSVRQGEVILKLDPRDWPARVEQARANLEQQQLEMKSVQNLRKKNLANQAQLTRAKTALANAKANYIQAKRQLDASTIRAPFDGVVDQREVEVGDFVTAGMPLVKVIDFDPFLVKANVPENASSQVKIGDIADIHLVDGKQVKGKVRFKSASANAQTRSYALEIEVDASAHTLNSGMTAEVVIPQAPTEALFVSPALLIINPEGELGLKAVDKDNKVIFLPVSLLAAAQDGVWVYGPKQGANIIVAGQGFVSIGEQVKAVHAHSTQAAKTKTQEQGQTQSKPEIPTEAADKTKANLNSDSHAQGS